MKEETMENMIMTSYEVDCWMLAQDFRYLGKHWEHKIYGKGYDRIAYENKTDYKGIKYQEHSKYKSDTYIKPTSYKD